MQAKPNKVLPALYGGIIMGVISGVPFLSLINCCCCAGILFGGLMAVFFYKKDLTQEMPPLSSSDALVVGALAGVFGAVVASVLDGLFMMALGNLTGEKIADLIREFYDRSGVTSDLPPGTLDQLDALRNAQFSALKVFQAFIIHPLFGLLGGLIGYAVFKPKPEVPAVPPTP
jgi:hypothetical protein